MSAAPNNNVLSKWWHGFILDNLSLGKAFAKGRPAGMVTDPCIALPQTIAQAYNHR